MRSQSSYFLYTLFHLFLPGLGQSYLGSWKKGLFFSTIFFCFFTSAYFLTQAQGLSEALPYLRIRCFPGGFLLFLNTVFLSLFPLVSTPETYQVQTYQLGQILLVILMIFNVMIWTEGLETLYWKKHPQASLALPEFPDRPFVFYMKKILLAFNLMIALGISFYWAPGNLKLLCGFPLCFVLSSVYQACRFQEFSRILRETEVQYLYLSYGFFFLYIFLLWL